uniref:Lipoprotein n=1 Tax=Parascaris equorum TaxID=6256 RepID=A0A914RH91_PAREQ
MRTRVIIFLFLFCFIFQCFFGKPSILFLSIPPLVKTVKTSISIFHSR